MFDISKVSFEESVVFEWHAIEFLYFTAPKEFHKKTDNEAINSTICIEHHANNSELKKCSVGIALTRRLSGSGDLEDYEWEDYDISDQDIEELLKLAEKERRVKNGNK